MIIPGNFDSIKYNLNGYFNMIMKNKNVSKFVPKPIIICINTGCIIKLQRYLKFGF